MRVAEIYPSVQGEGIWTGARSLFVRASGCNLRCGYCDTPYASWSPEGDDLAVDAIVEAVLRHDIVDVVLTGGEPMLFSELIPLTERLAAADRRITIETAGTLYLPVVCHLMSISPKLSNSTPDPALAGPWRARHESARRDDAVVRRLMAEYPYQLKFVVDTPGDLAEIEDYLTALPTVERERILVMPQGTDAATLAARGAWLEPASRDRGWQFCPRRQIEWFGLARAT